MGITHKIKLSELIDKFEYPIKFKAQLSTLHSDIVDFILKNYINSRPFKQKAVLMINTATAVVVFNESCDMDLSLSYDKIQTLDDEDLSGLLGDLYIPVSQIVWDITDIADVSPMPEVKIAKKPKTSTKGNQKKSVVETPKESLYLRPPVVPRFDINKPWFDITRNGKRSTIYTSLPIIPTIQNEISATTEFNKLTDNDFMNLFPNRFIRTRNQIMYEPYRDLPFDKDLGIIIPISGYSESDLRTNIIEYPHFYKLIRFDGWKSNSFYSQIEIDGTLYNTMDIWDDLPESKFIPRSAEYIKEYVVRRYLMEQRSGIEHKYPMYGSLDPFLTLFTTPAQYAEWGYNPLETAKSMVKSRLSFLRSRNPMLNDHGGNANCLFSAQCTNPICDNACPAYVETDYLLERNKCSIQSGITSSSVADIEKMQKVLHADKKFRVLISDNTAGISNLLTYCAICENWQGNRLHCNVYHLRFSSHLEALQRSWGLKEMPESLEYEQIWLSTAKILIISNIDFIKFQDFQSQTLLNIIHDRTANGLDTILVSPKISTLVGTGMFFSRIKSMLEEGVIST